MQYIKVLLYSLLITKKIISKKVNNKEEGETINTSVKKLNTSVKNVLRDEVKCAS